jgi:hypothetical protein
MSTFWSVADPTNQAAVFCLRAAASTLYIQNTGTPTVINGNDGTLQPTKSGLVSCQNAVRKRALSWGAAGQSVTGDGLSVGTAAFGGSMGAAGVTIGGSSTGTLPFYGTVRRLEMGSKQPLDAFIISRTA